MILKDSSPPAFRIGKEVRLQSDKKDRELQNVGPGTYTPSLKFLGKKSPPMFSMGSKLKLTSSLSTNMLTPEPGRYTPKY